MMNTICQFIRKHGPLLNTHAYFQLISTDMLKTHAVNIRLAYWSH